MIAAALMSQCLIVFLRRLYRDQRGELPWMETLRDRSAGPTRCWPRSSDHDISVVSDTPRNLLARPTPARVRSTEFIRRSNVATAIDN